MIFDKGNFVKINYCEKDYIGQVLQIDADVETERFVNVSEDFVDIFPVDIKSFKVKLLEFKTNCVIDNIFVRKFSDIQHYKITEKDV